VRCALEAEERQQPDRVLRPPRQGSTPRQRSPVGAQTVSALDSANGSATAAVGDRTKPWMGSGAATTRKSLTVPRSLAYAWLATSSASGRYGIMLSPSLAVGRPSAWVAWGHQRGLGRRRGSLDPPAVPTDPEVVRGAERQIPRLSATANLLL
jgi:hypothetical protein